MILRFTAKTTESDYEKYSKVGYINIDTKKEEVSIKFVPGKNYIILTEKGYKDILEEMDFNSYATVETLQVDTKTVVNEECLPFEVKTEE